MTTESNKCVRKYHVFYACRVSEDTGTGAADLRPKCMCITRPNFASHVIRRSKGRGRHTRPRIRGRSGVVPAVVLEFGGACGG